MFASAQMRERWRELRRATPGYRFQEWHDRAQSADRRAGMAWRVAMMIVAVLCLGIAFFLSVFPGPAIPFFLVAGALFALESRRIAKLLDWVEVELRMIWRKALRLWLRLPSAGRVMVLVTAGSVSVAGAYLVYRLLWA